MGKQGWRPAVVTAVAVLAAICASGSELPDAVSAGLAPGSLPADRYDFTPEDYRRSQRATALLVRQCMADRGHPGFPLDPRYPSDPLVATAVSTDYGAADLDDTRRWGYGWDPAASPATRPQGRRMTSAEYADHPACSAEANARLMRGIDIERDWLYASRRAVVVDKAVKRDKRIRAAWAEWSRCMTDRGFPRYRSPVAAYTDDAWRRGSDGNTRHTRRERATAVADVTCKQRHGTVDIWHAVQAEKQTADIERHRDRYAAGLAALQKNRANITDVLREFA